MDIPELESVGSLGSMVTTVWLSRPREEIDGLPTLYTEKLTNVLVVHWPIPDLDHIPVRSGLSPSSQT